MDPSATGVRRLVLGPVLAVPLFAGRVPAGFPSPAEDHEDAPLDLSRRFIVRPTASYMFQVDGDSMTGAGIFSGDYLVVDRSRRPRDGDVVLAVADGGFTVKFWRDDGRRIRLEAANPAYPAIPWVEGCEEWGVVTSVHRDLLPCSR